MDSRIARGERFGTVNFQSLIGSREKFNLVSCSSSSIQLYAIELKHKSNDGSSSYLRMDGGPSPKFEKNGFGLVSCEASIGPYETIHIEAPKI